jgi:hypothetical protein
MKKILIVTLTFFFISSINNVFAEEYDVDGDDNMTQDYELFSDDADMENDFFPTDELDLDGTDELDFDEENMSDEDIEGFEKILEESEIIEADEEISELLNAIRLEDQNFSIESSITTAAGFKKDHQLSANLRKYDGWLIKGQISNALYVIEGGKKRRISNPATFRALFGNKKVHESMLIHDIPTGADIVPGSHLFTCKQRGCPIYILDRHAKRHIPNMRVFNKYHFNKKRIDRLEKKHVLSIKNGPQWR